MKILMFTSEFPPALGGVGSHVYELGRALTAAGHEVCVVAPVHDYPEHEQMDGMEVYRPRLARGLPFYDWHLRHWVKKHLSFKPDIVHVHGLRPLWAAARMGLPVVFTNHTSGFLQRLSKSKSKLRRTLARINLSDYLLAPSDELVEAARTVGYQKPCQFISNGVDDQKFHPEGPSMREQWQIPEGRVVVLMARRLVEKNGVMYFAEAAKFLKDQPLQLVIAGQGDERDKVEKILAQHGMLEHTTFLGGVANHEMPQVYRAADISVLPSLMEATSITALETMACGVPLVTTNVGGLPFLVDHGNTGLLVEPREPEQLAAAIVDLAGDPERRAAMGRAARQRIEAELNWGQIAQQTVEAYQTTIGAYS